jgi:hypothetical protein
MTDPAPSYELKVHPAAARAPQINNMRTAFARVIDPAMWPKNFIASVHPRSIRAHSPYFVRSFLRRK